MPLPTNTTIPTKQPSFLDTTAMPFSGDVRMQQEWEEPHPGRRLSCPDEQTTTWGVLEGRRLSRGGMAVEGRWTEHLAADFSFAAGGAPERRIGRTRTRIVPQQLVLNGTSGRLSKPEIQTAPLPRQKSPHDPDHLDTPPALEVPGISPDLSGTDSDTDSSISAPPRKRVALDRLDTSIQGLQFTDFSNHLGISMDVDKNGRDAFSVVGSDSNAFSVMSPDDDIYGWNAVLHGKIPQSSSSGEGFAAHQQRRASRSKRSLLQRVFSPGGSVPDVLSPPTSFAGSDPSDPVAR